MYIFEYVIIFLTTIYDAFIWILYISCMLQSIVDILFPAKCSQCHNIGAYLCQTCLDKCEYAKELSVEGEKWITSLYSYRDKTIKNAIWEIKFHGHFAVAEAFGKPLANAIRTLLEQCGAQNAVLVPIPPSQSGGKKRGYNQTVMIARALIRNLKSKKYKGVLLLPNVLEKIKTTQRQAMIHNKELRLQNMNGAFAVSKQQQKLILGKIVVIVDDVTTTGATLKDAKRALLASGAKQVFAITIAH